MHTYLMNIGLNSDHLPNKTLLRRIILKIVQYNEEIIQIVGNLNYAS